MRTYHYVTSIKNGGSTILATEWNPNWRIVSDSGRSNPGESAGLQSVDLNSPADAAAAHELRVYAADLDGAKAALADSIRHAIANPEDGIYDSGMAAHSGAALGMGKVADAHGDQYILIRPTRLGDVNLDGSVTIAHFIDLASHFNAAGTWQEGDVNGDGQVSIGDFIDLASNFNSSYAGQSWAIAPQEKAMLAEFASSVGTVVPEPGAAFALMVIALTAARRQRRR